MARVLRSNQKLSQSNLNATANSFEPAFHHAVPPTESPVVQIRTVLGEITPNLEDGSEPPMASKNPVDVELKGLKAAFRSAIGIKKKKKPKKPKNPDLLAQTLEPLLATDPMTCGAIETPPYLQEYSGGATEVPASTDRNVEHEAPAPRMTRQQLAKQQSADEVRRELEGLINSRGIRAHLEQQPPSEVNNILLERDDKMLSPVDDKAPTAALQVAKKATEEMTMDGNSSDVQSPSEKAVDSDDDSFAQVIISRSPAKPVTRVEDYVDELDKLEDVMEALDEATSPNVKATSPGQTAFLSGKSGLFLNQEKMSRIFSPTDIELAKLHAAQETAAATKTNGYHSLRVKSKDGLLQVAGGPASKAAALRKAKSTNFEMTGRTASHSTQDTSFSRSADSKRPVTAPTAQNTRDLSRASSRATETRRPIANKRPASMLPPTKPQVKSTKPLTRPTFELPGEAISRKLKEQREARRAQRESEDVDSRAGSVAPKIKSAKAPTRVAFELPGDAISRRKREAHEARLKKQEEEEKKRREFKAKPSRCNFIVNGGVRETTATRTRQSMVIKGDTAESDAGKAMGTLTKRASTIGNHTNRQLSSTDSGTANIPAAVLRHRNLTPHVSIVGTARPAPTLKSKTSMTGLPLQRSTSIRKVSNNTQKGREIYQRQEKQIAEMQRERKEKEEAAKKSRELAAEKGRQASREWAEKQKAKMKSRDVGFGSGFGPGGQMGLRS